MVFTLNEMPEHGTPLDPRDAELLSLEATATVAQTLALRENSAATPMVSLPGLAAEIGISSLFLKDEGQRLGLGSFKALGGAYALMRLVQEQASAVLGRPVELEELVSDAVREIASGMTFACATDGNHGRSVAQGAQLIGANAVIFVHAGVSEERINAIARFGARMIRVEGSYDDSVAEASRVAEREGWTVLSDMSWPGYERIPGLVMQGYTAMVQEALQTLPEPPTHIFLQAGVGGFAAAIAGHFAVVLGDRRPHVTVVDPLRADCLYKSALAGRAVKVEEGEATVMAMLECYEPSLVAFRVLRHVGDAFMTVDEDNAIEAMKRLAYPAAHDDPVVSGESGCVGLAGLLAATRDAEMSRAIGLGAKSRVLIINTEGATDPSLYTELVGSSPEAVLARASV